MKKIALLILSAAMFTGCAGVKESNHVFSAHAECFRIIGNPIPADDQAAARALVPRGANIVTVHSTPADWTSFYGFLGNVFSFNSTTISGTK